MRFVIFAIALIGLTACATPYGEMGFNGGVEAQQMSATQFRIRARGNEFTEQSRIADFVLIKAAELAEENGFTHFDILSSQDASRGGSVVMPTYTTATVSSYGNTAVGSATTSGGQTYNYFMPGADVIVELTNEPKAQSRSASDVLTYIRPRYVEEQSEQ